VAENAVMPPVHRGEILLQEFLQPLGVSQYQLAKAIDVPAGGSMRSSTASVASP
jgi:plasmid maintenance system antidote protein VapI